LIFAGRLDCLYGSNQRLGATATMGGFIAGRGATMAKFEVRFEVGKGPNEESEVEVEAAMFTLKNGVYTFYERMGFGSGVGIEIPEGNVLRSIQAKHVIEVIRLSD
jgi:hypothetical protein